MLSPFLAHFPDDVLSRLNQALDGIHTFLIGGTTRNLVFSELKMPMGPHAFRDLDLICAAPVEMLEKRLKEKGFRPVPVGKQYEVVKIVLDGFDIDITPIQKEMSTIPADDEVEDLLLENLSTRDLTLNAMALTWPDGILKDPFGGQKDILKNLIRAVGDPRDRMREDPLRAMRAARFSAAHGFRLDDSLTQAMEEIAPRLCETAPERIRQELLEILAVPYPSIAMEILLKTGVLNIILPELVICLGVEQNRKHQLGVFKHSVLVCDLLPVTRPLLRLCALLHDVGKPQARRFSEMKSDYVFYGHQEISTDLAEKRLQALRFSNSEIDYITHLIAEHMFIRLSKLSPKAIRKWRGRLGPVPPLEAAQFMLADLQATSLDFSIQKDIKELLRILRRMESDGHPWSVKHLAITGKDLIGIGLKPGPEFSQILEMLLEIVLEDPLKNENDILLAEARKLAEGMQ